MLYSQICNFVKLSFWSLLSKSYQYADKTNTSHTQDNIGVHHAGQERENKKFAAVDPRSGHTSQNVRFQTISMQDE